MESFVIYLEWCSWAPPLASLTCRNGMASPGYSLQKKGSKSEIRNYGSSIVPNKKTYCSGLFLKFWGPPYSMELVGDTLACCTELTLRVFGLGLRPLMEDMTLPKNGRFRRVLGSSSPEAAAAAGGCCWGGAWIFTVGLGRPMGLITPPGLIIISSSCTISSKLPRVEQKSVY